MPGSKLLPCYWLGGVEMLLVVLVEESSFPHRKIRGQLSPSDENENCLNKVHRCLEASHMLGPNGGN